MPDVVKKGWDTSYEWKAVTLLGLGFGLAGRVDLFLDLFELQGHGKSPV